MLRTAPRAASILLALSLQLSTDAALYYNLGHVRQQSVDPSSLLFYEDEYPFAIASDLDQQSRHPTKFEWRSMLKRGRIVRRFDDKHSRFETFGVEWDTALDKTLISDISRKNRSMELSELVTYNHLLLGMCDYTGIVYKIQKEDGRVFQRHLINDGNGDEPKPFKIEWATVKDGLLFIGSIGLEWIENGKIKHRNPEWVKTISADGTIENINWHPIYLALRSATNTTRPGYLWHEAVHWDPRTRRWLFLPRKASEDTMYHPKTDETMGTDLIVLANEDFTHIDVKRFKPLSQAPPASPSSSTTTSSASVNSSGEITEDERRRFQHYESNEYGFTSVRKLPGSDGLFVATKVREVTRPKAGSGGDEEVEMVDETHTVMCVFDLDGNIRSVPRWIEVGDAKYEGLEFLS